MQLSKKNRPSFASAEETTALTGMLPGGVCPFGLPADLPLFVDSLVLEAGEAWAATPELPPLTTVQTVRGQPNAQGGCRAGGAGQAARGGRRRGPVPGAARLRLAAAATGSAEC